MKLKTIEKDGVVYAEVKDGKPVYTHDDGKDHEFDAVGTVGKIAQLNREAQGHREAKEAAEAKLKDFAGIEDAEAARKALELAKNIKDGDLIKAGQVEEIKAAAKRSAEEQVAAANKAATEALKRAEVERDDIRNLYNSEKIAGAFKGSKVIAEKVAIPHDMVQARFGAAFKIEEGGKLVGYGSDGNKIFSRVRPGDLADFDEAMEILIDQYPSKDQILKGTGNRGDGAARNVNTNGSGKKTIARREFEALPTLQKNAKMSEGYILVD